MTILQERDLYKIALEHFGGSGYVARLNAAVDKRELKTCENRDEWDAAMMAAVRRAPITKAPTQTAPVVLTPPAVKVPAPVTTTATTAPKPISQPARPLFGLEKVRAAFKKQTDPKK